MVREDKQLKYYNVPVVRKYSTDDFTMARLFILTIVILLGTTDVLAFQGVVNSSITIPCDIPEGFDTESVRWFVNVSTTPLLTYFPKDNITSPPDHDPRLYITDSRGLIIAPLNKSHSGIYNCQATSTLLVEDVEFATNLIVVDGCVMWAYSSPLMATSKGCSSGEVVSYAQECGFTCQQGFRLEGDAYTECQSDGELAYDRPNCEEVTCLIKNLSPYLIDTSNTCVEDARVRYGTICDFECLTGYNINGNGTIRIICGDGDIPAYPQCDKESGRLKTGYIVLIFVCILIMVIGIGIFLWFFRRRKYGLAGKDDANSFPLITTYKGFMDLLRQQIGDSSSAIIRVLQKLEQAELKNIPKLSIMEFIENKTSAKRRSVLDTFVRYVVEIVHCIDQSNTRASVELITNIMSAIEDSSSRGSTNTSISQLPQSQGTGNKSYFDVVHPAFVNLLVALRENMKDADVLKKRTTMVSKAIKSHFKGNKIQEGDTGLQSNEEISAIIPSNWARASDDTDFFAKMCLQNIDNCLNDNNKILLRYKILNIMIEPYNENKQFKIV